MAERSTRAAGQVTTAHPAAPSPEAVARSTADAFKAGRDQAIEETKAMVRDLADNQRRRAVETLGGVAGALHRTAKDLGTENKEMARYTDMAAERLDNVVRYLRQKEWTEMIDEAEIFARRQPWWVIGGAMAAGFIASRLIKGPMAEPPLTEAERLEPATLPSSMPLASPELTPGEPT